MLRATDEGLLEHPEMMQRAQNLAKHNEYLNGAIVQQSPSSSAMHPSSSPF